MGHAVKRRGPNIEPRPARLSPELMRERWADMERQLTLAQQAAARWQEIATDDMLIPLIEGFPECHYLGDEKQFVAEIILHCKLLKIEAQKLFG